MTENEAIEELHTSIDLAKMCVQNLDREREIEAYNMAIQALEEIQAYRHLGNPKEIEVMVKNLNTVLLRQHDELAKYAKLGTVEELKSLKENGAFSGVELAQLAAMQMRLRDYQAIGTVEECRAARERMKAKKLVSNRQLVENIHVDLSCPSCKRILFSGYYYPPLSARSDAEKYCENCGQAIDWNE